MARIDVEFINPFISGAMHTLQVQCGMKATPGKPFLKGDGVSNLRVDITGVIGITSPGFTGSISLSFPERTFLAIMTKMLGEEFKEISKDVEDGAGELLNIIFGSAKTVLNNKGFALEKALPSVVTGSGIRVTSVGSTPTVIVPFECEAGRFQIEIATEPVVKKEAA